MGEKVRTVKAIFRVWIAAVLRLLSTPFKPKPSDLRLFIRDFDDGAGRKLSAETQRKMLAASITRTTYAVGRNRCVAVKAPNGYEAREYRAGLDEGELDRAPVWADAVRYEAAEVVPPAAPAKRVKSKP
jgi:hypothetical protein